MRSSVVILALLALLPVAGPAAAEECAHWCGDCTPPNPNTLYFSTPHADPFYAQPDPMPCVPPGTVLDSREVTLTPMPGVGLPPVEAWQLKLLTTDSFGSPVAVVALVARPATAAVVPPPLFVYQEPYNSLGNTCHPSYHYSGSASHPDHAQFGSFYVLGLQAGWAVLSTDWGGHLAALGASVEGAHVVLDSIRAAESFEPLGLAGTTTPVGILGGSGGSPSTVRAAILQPTYAPEVNLVGMVTVGTIVDAEDILRRGQWTSFFPGTFSGVIGRTRAYPDFFPEANLNAAGVAAAEAMRDGCSGDTTDGSPPPAGSYEDYTTVDDPLGLPGAQAVFAELSLLGSSAVPATATYVTHGIDDETIPVALADELVAKWCAAGVDVHYNRTAGDHATSIVQGLFDGLRFLESRFTGTPFVPLPTTSGCE